MIMYIIKLQDARRDEQIMKKRILSRKNLILLISIVILAIMIILGFGYFKYRQTDDYQLAKVGYTKKEITQIKKLNEKDIETIKNVRYDKNIPVLISEKEFKKELFKEYYLYQSQHKTTADETIFVINNNLDENKEYDVTKVKSYLAMAKSNQVSPLTAVTLVNGGIEYSEIIPTLQQEKYYKEANLVRYLNYYNKTQKQAKEVITDVNSNIDFEFYTNVKKTDMTKGDLIIANKYYQLAVDYEPEDLVIIEGNHYAKKVVADAYEQMKQDALQAGLTLEITSAYRSYQTQESLYNRYKSEHGLAWADSYSARAGYSEHQTGLALDIVSNSSNFDNFEQTDEYEWLKKNCYKYGFILRYEENKEYITGYHYEPWHYRYVGIDVAKQITDSGITYEEYYEYYINK